jgi:hypothetical protein
MSARARGAVDLGEEERAGGGVRPSTAGGCSSTASPAPPQRVRDRTDEFELGWHSPCRRRLRRRWPAVHERGDACSAPRPAA